MQIGSKIKRVAISKICHSKKKCLMKNQFIENNEFLGI
jgi:hypothetical protein